MDSSPSNPIIWEIFCLELFPSIEEHANLSFWDAFKVHFLLEKNSVNRNLVT